MLRILSRFDRRYTWQGSCQTTTSELHRPAPALCLLAQICTRRLHIGPWQCRRTKPLFQIASAQFSVVQGRERALFVHCSLCHIHLKSSPLSLPTDTLNDGPPNNTEQIPLCAQVLNISATTVHPPPLPLLFRYLHMSERCRGHKRYSQHSLSPCSVKQANFKAFICLKPLINSAHVASLSLPLLK